MTVITPAGTRRFSDAVVEVLALAGRRLTHLRNVPGLVIEIGFLLVVTIFHQRNIV